MLNRPPSDDHGEYFSDHPDDQTSLFGYLVRIIFGRNTEMNCHYLRRIDRR
jgi:hypothetical protein